MPLVHVDGCGVVLCRVKQTKNASSLLLFFCVVLLGDGHIFWTGRRTVAVFACLLWPLARAAFRGPGRWCLALPGRGPSNGTQAWVLQLTGFWSGWSMLRKVAVAPLCGVVAPFTLSARSGPLVRRWASLLRPYFSRRALRCAFSPCCGPVARSLRYFRMHFMMSSCASVISPEEADHEQLSVAQMKMSLFMAASMYVKCAPVTFRTWG